MAPDTLYQVVNSDLSQWLPVPPLPLSPPVIRGVMGPALDWGIAPMAQQALHPWGKQAGCPHHVWSSCSSYSSWLVLGFVGSRRSPRLLPLFFFTKLFSPWISGADRSRDQALVPAALTLLPGHACGRAHGGQQSSPWAASTPHRGSPHGLWGSMHEPLGLPGHCVGSLQGRQAARCRTPRGQWEV